MKTLIAAALLLFDLTSTFAQENARGKWKPKKVLVDGFPTEWNNPLRLYDSETALFFDIENDSTDLILCFVCKDEARQIKINEAGMKIEIKAKGKSKCDAAINFPMSEKREHTANDQDNAGSEERIDQLKHSFVLRTQNGIIPLTDTSGIKLALNWDKKNMMTYEIAIPLKELFGKEFLLKDLTKVMTLKVEINAFERPSSKNPDSSPAASGGGMNTPGGNVGSGGMGSLGAANIGGNRGDRNSEGAAVSDVRFDTKTLKQGFFLAQER